MFFLAWPEYSPMLHKEFNFILFVGLDFINTQSSDCSWSAQTLFSGLATAQVLLSRLFSLYTRSVFWESSISHALPILLCSYRCISIVKQASKNGSVISAWFLVLHWALPYCAGQDLVHVIAAMVDKYQGICVLNVYEIVLIFLIQ